MELRNISSDSARSFSVDPEEMLQYEDRMIGTWHTHPERSANLSGLDMESFRLWPGLRHYIVGKDGVRTYVVDEGIVYCDEDEDPAEGTVQTPVA